MFLADSFQSIQPKWQPVGVHISLITNSL